MKAFITRSSDYATYPRTKTFYSLKELIEFQQSQKESIIISSPYLWDEEWGPTPDFQIEIYDDYRE